MPFVTVTTKAGDYEYPVEYREFESIEEYSEAAESRGENPKEAILGLINSAQKQGATQGPKGGVRGILEDPEATDEALEAEVAKAQTAGREYIVGAPRGTRNTTGVTKKAQREFGEKVTEAMKSKGSFLNQEELTDLAEEYGINPDKLNA